MSEQWNSIIYSNTLRNISYQLQLTDKKVIVSEVLPIQFHCKTEQLQCHNELTGNSSCSRASQCGKLALKKLSFMRLSLLFIEVAALELYKWATTWQNQQNNCAQQRLRSAWASAQSDQRLHCPHERKLGSSATHWAHSEDADQTGRMPRLIWVFAGRTVIMLVLSCCGSYFYAIIMCKCLSADTMKNVWTAKNVYIYFFRSLYIFHLYCWWKMYKVFTFFRRGSEDLWRKMYEIFFIHFLFSVTTKNV